jgi:small subunit ribosomal protein S17
MAEVIKRGVRKSRTGVVTSDKMDKTIVVAVTDRIRHPQYGKIVTRTKKFHAHDEKNEAHTGDKVRIVECRPLSRQKHWRLVEVVTKSARGDAE